MYSQYMDGSFTPLDQQEQPQNTQPHHAAQQKQSPPTRSNDMLRDITGNLSRMLGGIFRQFSVDRLDTGDILLVLIILFLFLEGDNLEVVIMLGLMLLLGLGDQSTE